MIRPISVGPRSLGALALALGIIVALPAFAADRTVKGPDTEGTPEYALVKAFEAAMADDFDAYLKVIHSEHRSTADQRKQREKYEWKRFKKQHTWYLRNKKPVTFVVTQVREEGSENKRYFLKDLTHPKRMPVPVRFKRDGNQWKIVVSSL